MAKHIVFLEQYGSLGGGQQVLLELARAALAEGMTVSVLIPEGACADKLAAMGATVRHVPEIRLGNKKKSLFDLTRFLWSGLRIFLKQRDLLRKADLIYANGNRLLPVAFFAETLLGKNAAFHIHLSHGPTEMRLFSWMLLLKRTKALIVPSPFIQRQLIAFTHRFDEPRLRLVENGLDDRFTGTSYTDRFTGCSLKHIGIVGRISPEKGQDVLLPLAQEFPELTFHVLGDAAFSDNAYEHRLRASAPENILFHGWVDDLPTKVDEIGLQVCLLPSRVPESASLVSMQMAALGCAVLVRRIGALEDMSKALGLASFVSDEDIAGCLRLLQERSEEDMALQAREVYNNMAGRYGCDAFQQRLRTQLTALIKDR